MKVATIKGCISGISGMFGAVATVISGQVQMLLPVSFGLFLFTLLIQYGSVKFKIVTSVMSLFGFFYFLVQGNPELFFTMMINQEVSLFGK